MGGSAFENQSSFSGSLGAWVASSGHVEKGDDPLGRSYRC